MLPEREAGVLCCTDFAGVRRSLTRRGACFWAVSFWEFTRLASMLVLSGADLQTSNLTEFPAHEGHPREDLSADVVLPVLL